MSKFFHYDKKTGEVVEGHARTERTMAGWPMAPCLASGVHPNQAQELRDCLSNAGVPTEVTSDGDPIYRTPTHRKRALKARHLVDKSSYC